MARFHLDPCFDDGALRLYLRPGDGPYLLVVFSGVGMDHAQWPAPEFIRFARETPQHSVLFVCDRGRSWLNAEGLIERLVDRITATAGHCGASRIVLLGNSMGGFMAIALADLVKARSVVAISPQWSVHPEVVPDERRWRRLRAAITSWRLRDLSAAFGEQTTFFVLHGAKPVERCHWQPLPIQPNIQHYIFPGISHFVVRVLRQGGHLHPLIAHAMARRPRRVRTMVEAAGGLKRKHHERHLRDRTTGGATEEG